MAIEDKKEKVSFIKEIFSPEYLKRDFDEILKEKRTSAFAFWGLFGLIAVNCLAVLAVFVGYVIQAIDSFTKS